MVLKSGPNFSAFCSGVVIAADVVLTAGHCVEGGQLRVLVKDAAGQNQLLEIASSATHPEYLAVSSKVRARSIDLALLRTKTVLPAQYDPVSMASARNYAVGARFTIAGYGLAAENDMRTGGKLRAGAIVAAAPLSSIVLHAGDPDRKGLGGCTGDSGGPVFDADGNTLAAITVWSTGSGQRQCGDKTDAVWVAPQRGWIDSILAKWGVR